MCVILLNQTNFCAYKLNQITSITEKIQLRYVSFRQELKITTAKDKLKQIN